MHGLLSKLLQKRNIQKLEELSPEEKNTFDDYEKILSKRELTIEDLKKFLEMQIEVIEGKWKDYDYQKKESLIPYHTCYKTLLAAIKAPELERSNLEQYLIQLIKK